MGCERSRSSTKETGYHCPVHEKGGASAGAGEEEGEEEGADEEESGGEEDEAESGGAVAAAPAAAAAVETEPATAAAAAVALLLLGVAQATLLLLLCGAGAVRVRRSRKRPRVVVVAVSFVTVVVVVVALVAVMGAIGAPWRREWARIVASSRLDSQERARQLVRWSGAFCAKEREQGGGLKEPKIDRESESKSASLSLCRLCRPSFFVCFFFLFLVHSETRFFFNSSLPRLRAPSSHEQNGKPLFADRGGRGRPLQPSTIVVRLSGAVRGGGNGEKRGGNWHAAKRRQSKRKKTRSMHSLSKPSFSHASFCLFLSIQFIAQPWNPDGGDAAKNGRRRSDGGYEVKKMN